MKRTLRLAGLAAFAWLFSLPISLPAQNASPLGGVGSLQFFNQDGTLLTSGVVYVYNAGTTTQATVYVDSTGTTTQPNPVTFGSGARASIWLANGTFVKIVLCIQNDGAFCSAGDILFTADNVPIGSSSSGGGGSPFTGIFISSTASPATSGTLRLASGDSVCWRNASGSANLGWSKDSNDLLSWAGGSFKLPEVGAPTGVPGFDIFWADNTAHRFKAVNNAGTAAQYVLSGNDIDVTDAVTKWHFGATQVPLSATAPTTNQLLRWDGTNIVGEGIAVNTTGLTANVGVTTLTTPTANSYYRFSCYVVLTTAAGTSATLPQCQINWTDADSSVAENATTNATSNVNAAGQLGPTQVSGINPASPIYAKSGVAITYQTVNYASNPASTMQYAIHLRLEGPL